MTTLHIHDDSLHVRFTRAEKVAGLVRDRDVPLSHVRDVDVVSDGLTAVSGLRAPGFSLPWRRKIGTWRRPGRKALVSVRRDQPVLRLRLEGDGYDELIVGTDRAEEIAASLSSRGVGRASPA